MHQAYSVEAELLGIKDFFPLKKTVEDIVRSQNQFYGYFLDNELAGVLELEEIDGQSSLIASMVVHPQYFRKGIASQLLKSLLETHKKDLLVSTAKDNLPAVTLYQKHGFKQTHSELLPDGLELVKMKWIAV